MLTTENNQLSELWLHAVEKPQTMFWLTTRVQLVEQVEVKKPAGLAEQMALSVAVLLTVALAAVAEQAVTVLT
jgi:hypothetical protein